MSTQQALPLPSPPPSNIVVINARCSLRMETDQRVIVVAGLPVHEDTAAEAYAMVFLVESGFALQTDVARAFGCSVRTVRRNQWRYAQGGMAALGHEAGWRRGRRRISAKRLRRIEQMKSQGMSNRAIAHKLGVTEKAIRKQVGPTRGAASGQLALPEIRPPKKSAATAPPASSAGGDDDDDDDPGGKRSPSAAPPPANDDEPVPKSLDRDASNRTFDRQLAYLGLLKDAAPLFRDGSAIPGAGVLLALPCLIESGLLRISRKLYGEIGPAFYGLRTTLLTLLLMALLRIKRPEHLKEKDPSAFGRLLGLDRAPEVKTLRRRLTRGFKIANARLGKQLRKALTHLTRLLKKRRDIPKRVEVRELSEQAMVKLATERKHLTDIIKMVAYQAESELIALMRPHYARIDDEGRTLLHELFATAGDISVSNSELQITLAPLSSPHRTLAAQALCDILNKTATVFPGSSQRMRFAVQPPRRIGLAFPGSPGKRGVEKVAVAAA